MDVSPAGRKLIENFEELRTKAYQDARGVWTIGYGHTAGVQEGMEITAAEADALLSEDLRIFSGEVDRSVGYATQHQFDAMVSLAFNIGLDGFLGSTALRCHRAAQYQQAAIAFTLWNKAKIDGILQPLLGLTRRRLKEALYYLEND